MLNLNDLCVEFLQSEAKNPRIGSLCSTAHELGMLRGVCPERNAGMPRVIGLKLGG
ncbi:MAG TPA: hypothetical protein VMX16_16710 [Terriglobia bacterium]|nr:hypothetical protein [Terriglobia bacterium]